MYKHLTRKNANELAKTLIKIRMKYLVNLQHEKLHL